MNAGLPGTGIGGVFYLVSALFMPFFELFKTLRGESNLERWRDVADGAHSRDSGKLVWSCRKQAGQGLSSWIYHPSRSIERVSHCPIGDFAIYTEYDLSPHPHDAFRVRTGGCKVI
jgi:hypothetical protein